MNDHLYRRPTRLIQEEEKLCDLLLSIKIQFPIVQSTKLLFFSHLYRSRGVFSVLETFLASPVVKKVKPKFSVKVNTFIWTEAICWLVLFTLCQPVTSNYYDKYAKLQILPYIRQMFPFVS